MDNGLSERDLTTIHRILKKYESIAIVKLFGSRASGNYKNGSDIDFSIMDKAFSDDDFLSLTNDFAQSNLPSLLIL